MREITYVEAVRDIESQIAVLQQRMGSSGMHGDPALSAIEQELIERLRMKMDEMSEVLLRFDRQDVRGAMDLVLTDIGLRNMEQIRALADQLIEHSNQRIAARRTGRPARRTRGRHDLRPGHRFRTTGELPI